MRWLISLIKIIALFCLVLVLCIAGTRMYLAARFDQPASAPEMTMDAHTPGHTVVNLPLQVSEQDLMKALEQYVPKTYTDVDDDPTDLLVDDEIRYDLQRGAIDISIIDRGIHFSFPVSGVVRTQGKINLRVTKIPASAHANVAGRIYGDLRFEILPDWQVRPDLNFSVDFDEARIPVENLGSISLRTFLKTKLTEKIEKERYQLVHKIFDKNRIRREVEKAWKTMHRVEPVHDDPAIWARVTPVAIGLMPLINSGSESSVKTLKIGLQVVLKTDLLVARTKPDVMVTPLPDASMLDRMADTFQIRVPFQIEPASVNNFLANEVAGKSRTVVPDVNLTVQQAAVVCSSNNRVTAIVFADLRHAGSGLDVNIRLYTTGHLVFDPDAVEIRLADITYDATFSRWWMGLLNWTVYPYLRYQLAEQLVWPLEKEIQKADAAIDKLIAELVVPPGILADLSVETPSLNYLGTDPGQIFGELQLDGRLSAKLDLPATSGDTEPPK
ncbi:MAG: DUF4403 family protein [Thermodesulfobacteriota bacterium]|nr:DUF4403 family protein [Thermodesulfobacteriota bacterium]